MQTFLPYADFTNSAKCLDYRRLGKQRVEAYQILQVVEGKQSGWANHPAVKMWMGYPTALKAYFNAMLDEWVCRGYNNSMQWYYHFDGNRTLQQDNISLTNFPWWLGQEEFHRAMRARLIEKDPNFYGPKFPGDKGYNNGLYWWPNMETKFFYTI